METSRICVQFKCVKISQSRAYPPSSGPVVCLYVVCGSQNFSSCCDTAVNFFGSRKMRAIIIMSPWKCFRRRSSVDYKICIYETNSLTSSAEAVDQVKTDVHVKPSHGIVSVRISADTKVDCVIFCLRVTK